MAYSAEERKTDFEFYKEHLRDYYNQFGCCWLAIRNKELLGHYSSPGEAIDHLESRYRIGEYSIQKCDKDESAYTITVYGVGAEK